MSRVIHAQFVVTDYDEDDPLRLEDLRSNIENTLGHSCNDIEFHFEGDKHYICCVQPEGEVLNEKELEQLRREMAAFPTDNNLAGLQGGYVVALIRRLIATVEQWQREAFSTVPDGSEEPIDVEFEELGRCPVCGAPRGTSCDGGLHG